MLLVIAIHPVAINRFIHVLVYSTTCEFRPRRAPLKLYTHFEWSPTWAHLGGISWAERVPRVGSLQWWKWGKERPDLEPLTWEVEPRGRAPAQWSSASGILPTGECARGCPAPRQVNHRRARPPGAWIARSGAGSVPRGGPWEPLSTSPPHISFKVPNTHVLSGTPQSVTSPVNPPSLSPKVGS